jgi:hypothetical protein
LNRIATSIRLLFILGYEWGTCEPPKKTVAKVERALACSLQTIYRHLQAARCMSSLFPFGLKGGTFVHSPLPEVERCLLHWASGNPANRDIRGRRVRSSLCEALPFLEPRFFNPDRGLIIGHASGWTAFFDNHSRQFAPAAELHILALHLRTRTCFFGSETEEEQAGSAMLEYNEFDGAAGVNTRLLWLAEEGKWRFKQVGNALPFERMEVYQAARIRDRLTPDLLREYGDKLGIRFWESEGYWDETVLLTWKGDVPGQRAHGELNP